MVCPSTKPSFESTAVLTAPPRDRCESQHAERVRATHLSSSRATIWTETPIASFPVYLGFDGLAPYVVEGRVVADVPANGEAGIGQVVEFTAMLHRDELIFE